MVKKVTLIEPVPIVVQQLDKNATEWSDGVSGRRESFNNKVRTTINFEAQVVFGNTEQTLDFTQLGASQNSAGYLLVVLSDLAAAGIDLKKGDKIISIGGTDFTKSELFLIHDVGKPAAQFTGSGFTLAKAFFEDRTVKGDDRKRG